MSSETTAVDRPTPLKAFVSFPSPYTQSLLLKALVSLIPALSISLLPPDEDHPPALQWADYDLLSLPYAHAHPSTHLISSYIYRKALIRKHQLHATVLAYLAKCRHRGTRTALEPEEGGWPKGWACEVRFKDELDELLMDDLYELGQALEANEGRDEGQRTWFILKPGFADRAQGIRMFSTLDEMYRIFEEFEESSSEEEDEDDPEARESDGNDTPDEVRAGDNADDEDEEGTGVLTSQLRHFLIQEYLPRPMLFHISQLANEPDTALVGQKFHLRAYVLLVGGYSVYLSRTMLALFSSEPYVRPTSADDLDLRPHLTNTCLQTDAFGAPTPPKELVKTFWELEGLTALSHTDPADAYASRGRITKAWLDETFVKVGEVVSESVKAGAECGSFGLQFMPNAFEVFGVDLLLSFPSTSTASTEVPIPKVTLLEYNASPDFHQSGERLRPQLLDMFKGIVKIAIKPFFGLSLYDKEEAKKADSWVLVGQGEVRAPGA